MNNPKSQANSLEQELTNISQQIWNLAQENHNSSLDLILILRQLESIHSKIREELLEPSLPDTRHNLYLLLKHIEEMGGWPYIPRMKLNQICQRLINSENRSLSDSNDKQSPK